MNRLRSSLLLLLGLLAFGIARSQQNGADTGALFRLTRTVAPGEHGAADFTVDNLGNIYILGKDNQLRKLSPQGDSLAVFNDVRRFGRIASIDVTNPLKILVYYREFSDENQTLLLIAAKVREFSENFTIGTANEELNGALKMCSAFDVNRCRDDFVDR